MKPKSAVPAGLLLAVLFAFSSTFWGCADLKKEEQPTKPTTQKVTYKADIKPILDSYCVRCHGAQKLEGNYDLSNLLGILGNGSDDVPNVIPGDPSSLLVLYTRPNGKMFQYLGSENAADLIYRWVVTDSLSLEESEVHPEGWAKRGSDEFHGKFLKAKNWDLSNCQKCHGEDFRGGIAKSSCYTCHDNYPHPQDWKENEQSASFHGVYVKQKGPTNCAFCHGTDYQGAETGVSCFTCHQGAGGHPKGWTDPQNINFHGLYLLNTSWKLSECQECHGTDYSGGTSGQSCMACHPQGPEACNVCHGQPPIDDSTLPIESERGVDAAGAHKKHVTEEGFSCTECHGDIPTSVAHADRLPAEMDFVSAAQLASAHGMQGVYQDTGSPTDGNGTCSNIYCHSDGKGGPAAVTPSWVGMTMTCVSCHDVAESGSGAHSHHLEHAQISCQTCHVETAEGRETVKNESLHIRNAQVDVAFDPAINPDAAGYGSAGPGTCSNLYCHSDGKGGPPAVQAVWTGGDLGCTGCHDVAKSGSGAHEDHLEKNISCVQCHFETADEYMQIKDDSKHIFNRKVDVAFNPALNPDADPYETQGSATCSGLYCHGTGLPGGSNTAPRWSGEEEVKCGSCHDTGTFDTTPETVISTGMHSKHVRKRDQGGLGFACNVCHTSSGSEKHVNGSIDFSDGKTSLAETQVCQPCHGSGTDQAKAHWDESEGAWLREGGYCESCHDGSSTIAGKQAPAVTAHFTTSGHGNSGPFAGTEHGKNGPGYTCAVCHNPNSPNHINPAVHDYRLVIANDQSQLCNACHSPAGPGQSFGADATDATIHGSSVTGRYSQIPQYNYQCVVCHDPHGTSNLAMIRESIDGGLGAGPVPVSLKDDLKNLDPSADPDNGVCDVCHAQGGQPHPDTNHPGNHNHGIKCVLCHKHSKGFWF